MDGAWAPNNEIKMTLTKPWEVSSMGTHPLFLNKKTTGKGAYNFLKCSLSVKLDAIFERNVAMMVQLM